MAHPFSELLHEQFDDLQELQLHLMRFTTKFNALHHMAKFSRYVHKGALKPHSFHFVLQKRKYLVCHLYYTLDKTATHE